MKWLSALIFFFVAGKVGSAIIGDYSLSQIGEGELNLEQREWISLNTEYAYLEIAVDLDPLERSLRSLQASCSLLLVASTHANASNAIRTEAIRRHSRCRNTANRTLRKYDNLKYFLPKVRLMSQLEAEFNKYRDSATQLVRDKRFLFSAAIFGAAAVGGLVTHTIESWIGGDDELRHRVDADEVFTKNIAHHLEDTEHLVRKVALQVGEEFDELLLFETLDILVIDAKDTANWILQALSSAIEQKRMPLNLVDGSRLLHELDIMRIRFLDRGRVLATTKLEEIQKLPLLMAQQDVGTTSHLLICVLIPTTKASDLLRIYAPRFPVLLVSNRPYVIHGLQDTLLAVKEDQTGYTLAANSDLSNCPLIEQTYYCPPRGLVRTDFRLTCLSAIWIKDPTAITAQCALMPLAQDQPFIKGLNSTSFLYVQSKADTDIKVFCGNRIKVDVIPMGATIINSPNCTVRGPGFSFKGTVPRNEVDFLDMDLNVDLADAKVHPGHNTLDLPVFESLPMLEPLVPHAHRALNSAVISGLLILMGISLGVYLYHRYHERFNLPKPGLPNFRARWTQALQRQSVRQSEGLSANAPEVQQPSEQAEYQPPSYSNLREQAILHAAQVDQPLLTPPPTETPASDSRRVAPFNARNHGF